MGSGLLAQYITWSSPEMCRGMSIKHTCFILLHSLSSIHKPIMVVVDYSVAMKRHSLLLLYLLFQLLSGTVEALHAAAGAETTFFYQAYLLEREHVTNPRRRLIAPACNIETGTTCTFAQFVRHISSDETNAENGDRFDEIFERAEAMGLKDLSRSLREAGFRSAWDQTRLYPKEGRNPSVTVTIRGMRGIATATKDNKYQDKKRKMIEALELLVEVRRADNMRFLIPKLEKATGVTLETKPATTPDGREYTTYDVDKTAAKNKGVEDLAQKIQAAAETLREVKKDPDSGFVIHQRIIREAELSIKELQAKC